MSKKIFGDKNRVFELVESDDPMGKAENETPKKPKNICQRIVIEKADNGYTIEKQMRDYEEDKKLHVITDLKEVAEYLDKAFKE